MRRVAPATVSRPRHAGALATAAAVAVAEALGARLEGPSVGRALAHLAQHDLGGRLDLVARGDGLWVVDDSYNANPASFASSLACLAEIAALEGRPTVLVLGEMRELGLEADAAHDALGELAAESGARLLVTVGPLARRVGARAAAHGLVVRSADDAEEAGRIATGAVRPDDVVLVKGSRGVHTEQVVEALLAGNEGTAA